MKLEKNQECENNRIGIVTKKIFSSPKSRRDISHTISPSSLI